MREKKKSKRERRGGGRKINSRFSGREKKREVEVRKRNEEKRIKGKVG